MKNRSPFIVAVAVPVSIAIVIPVDIAAQAGQVSRAIPDVAIARGTQKLQAPVKTLVDWGDVTYGRMRSQVVKQAKPNAKFEVHTAVGVAGVVGTDFFLGYLNGIFQLIVFDGHVKFCNLDGACVDVLAGQIATIRDGHKSPDQPSQATATELTEAANATMMGTTAGEIPVHHIGAWTWVGMTILVAVPAIVIPIATRGHSPTPVLVTNGCSPNNPKACG